MEKMMHEMCGGDKKEALCKMMEEHCAGMSDDEKKEAMSEMMPRMMKMIGGEGGSSMMGMMMKECMRGFRWFPLIPLVLGLILFSLGYFLTGESIRVLWLIVTGLVAFMGLLWGF